MHYLRCALCRRCSTTIRAIEKEGPKEANGGTHNAGIALAELFLYLRNPAVCATDGGTMLIHCR